MTEDHFSLKVIDGRIPNASFYPAGAILVCPTCGVFELYRLLVDRVPGQVIEAVQLEPINGKPVSNGDTIDCPEHGEVGPHFIADQNSNILTSTELAAMLGALKGEPVDLFGKDAA